MPERYDTGSSANQIAIQKRGLLNGDRTGAATLKDSDRVLHYPRQRKGHIYLNLAPRTPGARAFISSSSSWMLWPAKSRGKTSVLWHHNHEFTMCSRSTFPVLFRKDTGQEVGFGCRCFLSYFEWIVWKIETHGLRGVLNTFKKRHP